MGSVSAVLGRMAAEKPMVEKLAADSGLPVEDLEKMAAAVEMTPGRLAREAYADPEAFAYMVRVAYGVEKTADSETQKVNHPQAVKKPNPFAKKKPAGALPMNMKTAGALGTTFIALAKKAIEKKAADNRKKTAMVLMNHFLDKVAGGLGIDKQASVRMLQAQLALGKPMSYAIKVAYPQLTGEKRGILASKLVKGAADDFAAFIKKKQNGPKTATGKPGSPEVNKMMKEAGLGKAPARGETVAAGHTKQANRVLAALGNMFRGNAATAQRGGQAFNKANAGGLKDRLQGMMPQHRGLAGQEYAGNMRAAQGQAIGDRNMARAAAGGLAAGGAGVLGANAMTGGGKPTPDAGMGAALAGAGASQGAMPDQGMGQQQQVPGRSRIRAMGRMADSAGMKMGLDKQAISPELITKTLGKATQNLYNGILPGGRITKSMIPGAKLDQAAAPSMLGGISPERLAATQRLGRFQKAMQRKDSGMTGMTPGRQKMRDASVANLPMRRPDMGQAQLNTTTFGPLPGGVPSKLAFDKVANPLLKALLSKAPGALPKMKGVGEKVISRTPVARPPAAAGATAAPKGKMQIPGVLNQGMGGGTIGARVGGPTAATPNPALGQPTSTGLWGSPSTAHLG